MKRKLLNYGVIALCFLGKFDSYALEEFSSEGLTTLLFDLQDQPVTLDDIYQSNYATTPPYFNLPLDHGIEIGSKIVHENQWNQFVTRTQDPRIVLSDSYHQGTMTSSDRISEPNSTNQSIDFPRLVREAGSSSQNQDSIGLKSTRNHRALVAMKSGSGTAPVLARSLKRKISPNVYYTLNYSPSLLSATSPGYGDHHALNMNDLSKGSILNLKLADELLSQQRNWGEEWPPSQVGNLAESWINPNQGTLSEKHLSVLPNDLHELSSLPPEKKATGGLESQVLSSGPAMIHNAAGVQDEKLIFDIQAFTSPNLGKMAEDVLRSFLDKDGVDQQLIFKESDTCPKKISTFNQIISLADNIQPSKLKIKKKNVRQQHLIQKAKELHENREKWLGLWMKQTSIDFSITNPGLNPKQYLKLETAYLLFLFYVQMINRIMPHSSDHDNVMAYLEPLLGAVQLYSQVIRTLTNPIPPANELIRRTKFSLESSLRAIKFNPHAIAWVFLDYWIISFRNDLRDKVPQKFGVSVGFRNFFNNVFCYSITNLTERLYE